MTRLGVIADWRASYADPLRVRRGEAPAFGGRRDLREGHLWLRATNSRGKSGWVPNDLRVPGSGVALRDFDALELTCAAGETREVLEARHGWRLWRNATGATGWIPARCLRPLRWEHGPSRKFTQARAGKLARGLWRGFGHVPDRPGRIPERTLT